MRTETATKKITASGDSLVINVTKEVKRLGLDRGDDVDVTLAPIIDDLYIMAQIMANAITGLGLVEVDDIPEPIVEATKEQVELIFKSVCVCAPPGLDIRRPRYGVIGIFDKDNRPLMEYEFRITEDHD